MASRSLDDLIDELVAYMSLASPRRMNDRAEPWHNVPLSFFDPATALGFPDSVLSDDDWFAFNPEIENIGPSAVWPIDARALVPGEGSTGQRYVIHRIRSVAPKEVRGRARFVSPSMLEVTSGSIDDTGDYFTARTYAAWYGGRWLAGDAESEQTARIGVTFALTDASWWKVALGYEGFPRVAFHTDPAGAREVFRLRDIPEGKSRRAALRHWVSRHWRRRANDGPKDVEVMKHLRGATQFSWNGLSCELFPSRDALIEAGKRSE